MYCKYTDELCITNRCQCWITDKEANKAEPNVKHGKCSSSATCSSKKAEKKKHKKEIR